MGDIVTQTYKENREKTIYGKALLRVDEVARFLNISKRLAYMLVAEGHFRVLKINSAIRVSADSVLDYVDRQAQIYEIQRWS